jgi:hypothetical protein
MSNKSFTDAVQRAIDEAPGALVELEIERDLVNEHIRLIRDFMKVMGVEQDKPKPKRRRRTAAVTVGHNHQAVINAIAAMHHEKFTTRDVAEILPDISTMSIAQSLSQMRRAELLGKLGKIEGAQMWKVMDLERLTAVVR